MINPEDIDPNRIKEQLPRLADLISMLFESHTEGNDMAQPIILLCVADEICNIKATKYLCSV